MNVANGCVHFVADVLVNPQQLFTPIGRLRVRCLVGPPAWPACGWQWEHGQQRNGIGVDGNNIPREWLTCSRIDRTLDARRALTKLTEITRGSGTSRSRRCATPLQ